jgi:hypothetical protein
VVNELRVWEEAMVVEVCGSGVCVVAECVVSVPCVVGCVVPVDLVAEAEGTVCELLGVMV